MLRHSGVLDHSSDPELDHWTAALRRSTGATATALSFVDASHRLVKSICTADGSAEQVSDLPLAASFRTYVLGLARPSESAEPGGSYREAPITVDGHLLGQIAMGDHGVRDWAEADLEVLSDTARSVSTVIALRLAKKDAQRVQELVTSHNKVHDLIATGASLRDVLVEVLESVERYDPSIKASVRLLDRTSNTLHSAFGPSLPDEYLASINGAPIGPNVGTCGPAAWFGKLTITANIAEDPKWAPIRDEAESAGLAHCWSTPIKTSGGDVLGTLAFYGPTPRQPLPEHLTLLEDWARVAGIAIERSEALERLVHDARHDSLTGLPNRMAIFEALDEAISRVTPEGMAAAMFIDLDRLKHFNDTLGHHRADELICEVGERMTVALRPNDFVGRFGGDEFVAIVEGIVDREEAAVLGLRLLEAVSRPLPGFDSMAVTASIGIALVRNNAVDAREVIQASDSAMYEAKKSGRDRLTFFDGTEPVSIGRRLLLARRLRDAETRGELRLVFQPIFSLPAMEIVGVEALLRWGDPTVGEVAPAEFIPIAEDTGAIVPIGAWALRESCETIARATAPGHAVELHVNVSRRQASDPDFALWVRQTLAHAEFPADKLAVEITKTSLMQPNAIATRNLRALDALGVRIVLDDFGTGYSSLSWLKRHPFSAINIDRSFITDVAENSHHDHAIVDAVIGMAKALKCTVTAEGVETDEQLAALLDLGCERAQGFLLARPVSATEVAALIRGPRQGVKTPARAGATPVTVS
jgi:diguanylate cyclase (GGDEF)-like protein